MTTVKRFAEGYGRRAEEYAAILDPTLGPIVQTIVRLAGPTRSTRILDLATGTGTVARALAAAGASVVGLDASEPMVALARRLSPAEIQFHVGDAAALPFPPGSFDLVTCSLGISHMPDAAQVLAEILRVLTPGGRLLISAWGAEGRNPALAAVQQVLQHHVPGSIGAFEDLLDETTWSDPELGGAALRSAGFDPVETVTEVVSGRFADAHAAVDWAFAWPNYGETLDALGETKSARVRAEAETAVAAAGDHDWEYTVNVFRATRPSPPGASRTAHSDDASS